MLSRPSLDRRARYVCFVSSLCLTENDRYVLLLDRVSKAGRPLVERPEQNRRPGAAEGSSAHSLNHPSMPSEAIIFGYTVAGSHCSCGATLLAGCFYAPPRPIACTRIQKLVVSTSRTSPPWAVHVSHKRHVPSLWRLNTRILPSTEPVAHRSP